MFGYILLAGILLAAVMATVHMAFIEPKDGTGPR